MTEMKSQFVSTTTGTYSKNEFLLDSLTLTFADTRKGFNSAVSSKIATMKEFVATDTVATKKFNAYVAKLSGKEEAPAKQAAKPVVTTSSGF